MKVTCKSCSASLKVADSLAGKRGKCAKCGAVVQIPAHAPLSTAGVPATAKQKDYATSLGIAFDPAISKHEIGALISAAVERQDDERWRKLNELGSREGAAYVEIRQAILAELAEEGELLSKATPEQMLSALEERGRGAVLIHYDADRFDIDNLKGSEVTIEFTDDHSESEMRRLIIAMGGQMVRKLTDS